MAFMTHTNTNTPHPYTHTRPITTLRPQVTQRTDILDGGDADEDDADWYKGGLKFKKHVDDAFRADGKCVSVRGVGVSVSVECVFFVGLGFVGGWLCCASYLFDWLVGSLWAGGDINIFLIIIDNKSYNKHTTKPGTDYVTIPSKAKGPPGKKGGGFGGNGGGHERW